MSNSSQPSNNSPTPPEKSTAMLMIGDIGDTTWRMFVPTIGLALVGVHFDNKWGFTPWCMLAGALIGGLISVFLIKQQLQRVNTR